MVGRSITSREKVDQRLSTRLLESPVSMVSSTVPSDLKGMRTSKMSCDDVLNLKASNQIDSQATRKTTTESVPLPGIPESTTS